jgi:hypothetical protein
LLGRRILLAPAMSSAAAVLVLPVLSVAVLSVVP